MFTLNSLQFHGMNGTSTIPLRKNQVAGTSVRLPEWTAGISGPSAPVAFIVSESSPVVHVTLQRSETAGAIDVEISAEDLDGNLLGRVEPQVLHFNDGEDTVVQDVRTTGVLRSVALHLDRWRWSARTVNSPSQEELATTSHPIYAVLGTPDQPWQTVESESSFWVWSDVLDVACNWASGATKWQDAANRITGQLFSLGDRQPPKVEYNLDADRLAFNRPMFFMCAEFLTALRGPQMRIGVDCQAVSSIITTLTNSLGGHLLEATLEDNPQLPTASVRFLGAGGFGATDFSLHELAAQDPAATTSLVWDGCVQLGTGTKLGVPVINIVFDNPGSLDDYLGHVLLLPTLPLTPFLDTAGRKINRGVMPDARLPELPSLLAVVSRRLGEDAHKALMKEEDSKYAPLFVSEFFWRPSDLQGLKLLRSKSYGGPFRRAEARWVADTGQGSGVVLYEAASRDEAREIFAARLSEFSGPVQYVPNVGDVAFRDKYGRFAVVMSGNAVWTATAQRGSGLAENISFEQVANWIQPLNLALRREARPFPAPVRVPLEPLAGNERAWTLLEGVNGRITRAFNGLFYTQTAKGERAVKMRSHTNSGGISESYEPV